MVHIGYVYVVSSIGNHETIRSYITTVTFPIL